MPQFTTLKLEVGDRLATITLNRPERLNAINGAMPGEIRGAVEAANADERVHVIVLRGAGKAFCAGYDLKEYAEGDRTSVYTQPMPWDPMLDYRVMKKNTDDFMSLWRSYKPTIARVHGYAAAGGSDIATCCDFIVMEDKARIGYMPVRVWGCPTPAMWVYRLDTVERYRKLVLQEKVEVVLGGISTGVTLALGPVAEDMGTPWLSWDGTTQRGRRGNDADHEVGLPERGQRGRDHRGGHADAEVLQGNQDRRRHRQRLLLRPRLLGDLPARPRRYNLDVKFVLELFPKLGATDCPWRGGSVG